MDLAESSAGGEQGQLPTTRSQLFRTTSTNLACAVVWHGTPTTSAPLLSHLEAHHAQFVQDLSRSRLHICSLSGSLGGLLKETV